MNTLVTVRILLEMKSESARFMKCTELRLVKLRWYLGI